MTWYACWGAAALHPTMRDLADPAPRREVRMTRWRLGLLAGASLLAPAVQVVQLVLGRHTEGLHGLAGEVAALAATRKQLLERTVQAREEERIWLAADLHDGPIRRLSGVAYTADLSRRRVTRGDLAGGQELLDSLEEDIRGEVAALRRVMVELRPPALDEWGLVAALGDHAATFRQQTGIACTVEAELPVRLPGAQETVLYRVVQEALTNVAKHAGLVAPGCRCGSSGTGCRSRWATTAPASPPRGWPTTSARTTSAWPACASRSRWPAGSGRSVPGPARAPPSPPPCRSPAPAGRRAAAPARAGQTTTGGRDGG